MGFLLFLLALLFGSVEPAQAQCTGIFTAGTLCGNFGSSSAPPSASSASAITSYPILHPSSGNIVGAGCSVAHQIWWVNQNLCSTSDVWEFFSKDPSALFRVTVGGTTPNGSTAQLTFTFGSGACVAGCAVSVTASGDTTTTLAGKLACAIANDSRLFNMNGGSCSGGTVTPPAAGNGGYTGKQVGFVISSATVVALDFDSTVPMAVTTSVSGGPTLTITNTNCAAVCSKEWDNNPVFATARLVTDGAGTAIAPPASSQLFTINSQSSNSAAPSAVNTTYGIIQNQVVNSTSGALSGRWALVTPTVAGVMSQGIYVGAGLYTVGAIDGGVNTITANAAISSTANVQPGLIGQAWSIIGGATPVSYCFNWTAATFLDCLFLGTTFDFKPNNGTGGVTISTNVMRPDTDNATTLGDNTHNWSTVFAKAISGLTTPLSLAQGGTNASLTASDTAIITSDTTKLVVSTACLLATTGSFTCTSTTSNNPSWLIRNSTNDTLASQIQAQKDRAGGAVTSGDNLFSFLGAGFANAAYRNSAQFLFAVDAAPSGNNVPSNVQLLTSNAAGQLNQTWKFNSAAHTSIVQASPPTVTSCGGGSPAITAGSTDMAGEVTLGTTATACTISFATAFTVAPKCVVTWQANPLATQNYSISTSAITLGQTSTSSNKVNWVCGPAGV